METAPLVKVSLKCWRYFLSEVRSLSQWIAPAPIYVAFQDDILHRDAWVTMDYEEFLASKEDSPLSFLSLHAFMGEPELSELWHEDSDLFNIDAYRQNPAALWELYVWDASEVLVILPNSGQLTPPPDGWSVNWVKAVMH